MQAGPSAAGEEVARAFEGCPSETAEAGRAGVCEGCPGQSLCQTGLAPDPGARPLSSSHAPGLATAAAHSLT